ncbi:MAG: hypothetical protein J6Y62_08690 [Clostridia bacterium]|nr:hypothetical protein [Clostridia bacterium]
MVNKIVEVLSKGLGALTKVLSPVLNTVLKPLWDYTNEHWYRTEYKSGDLSDKD